MSTTFRLFFNRNLYLLNAQGITVATNQAEIEAYCKANKVSLGYWNAQAYKTKFGWVLPLVTIA